MNERTKESKFLSAINQYAEKQKALISSEVERYKNQKIQQATEAGIKDAYELIQREIADRKTALIAEYSAKEAELRRGLFRERSRVASEVFALAEKKLIGYTATPEYKEAVIGSARKIREQIGSQSCEVYIKESDMPLAETIGNELPGSNVIPREDIRIGGIKAFCAEAGLMLDCTLDSALKAQRGWFTENSGLEVVKS